jgi:hypothetical protein
VYRKQPEGLPVEMLLLGMVSSRSFREVKGDLETLLSRLHISTFSQELNDSQIPAMIAASTVLSLSSSPWNGPIGGVRVGNGNPGGVAGVAGPTRDKRERLRGYRGRARRIPWIAEGLWPRRGAVPDMRGTD